MNENTLRLFRGPIIRLFEILSHPIVSKLSPDLTPFDLDWPCEIYAFDRAIIGSDESQINNRIENGY